MRTTLTRDDVKKKLYNKFSYEAYLASISSKEDDKEAADNLFREKEPKEYTVGVEKNSFAMIPPTAPKVSGLSTEVTPKVQAARTPVSRETLRKAALRLEESHNARERTAQPSTIKAQNVKVLSSGLKVFGAARGQTSAPVVYSMARPPTTALLRGTNEIKIKIKDKVVGDSSTSGISWKPNIFQLPKGWKTVPSRLTGSQSCVKPTQVLPYVTSTPATSSQREYSVDLDDVGDFESSPQVSNKNVVGPTNIFSTNLRSFVLPSGAKAISPAKLSESVNSNHNSDDMWEDRPSSPVNVPTRMTLRKRKPASKHHVASTDPSPPHDVKQPGKGSAENESMKAEMLDYYLQKWYQSFHQRNSDVDKQPAKSSGSKSIFSKTIECTDSTTILYERPDEETASVLLRLSLGKTVTLEELDKIIMYLVRLKYLCFGGGSDATEPQEQELQSNSLDRSLDSDYSPPPQDPDSDFLASDNDEPPLMALESTKSVSRPARLKRRLESPKKHVSVKMAKIIREESLDPLPILEASCEATVCTPTSEEEPSLPEPGPSKSGVEPSESSPLVNVEIIRSASEKKPTKRRRKRGSSGLKVRQVKRRIKVDPSVPEDMKCKQCGLKLFSNQKYKTHFNSCKGILARCVLRASVDSSDVPEEEQVEQKCQHCDENLSNVKDYEMHMAAAHGFSWCYQFASQEEFQSWFEREEFGKTVCPYFKHTSACGEKRSVYSCVYNDRNDKSQRGKEKCPYRLVIHENSDGIHAAFHSFHNHAERRTTRKFRKFELPPNSIRVNWRRSEEAEPTGPNNQSCTVCDEMFTEVKDYEMHMAAAHSYSWFYEFASEEEYRLWFTEEGFRDTMYQMACHKHSDGYRYQTYYCTFNNARVKRKKGDTCPCEMKIRFKSEGGVCVEFNPVHSHAEKIIKPGLRRFRLDEHGILIKWPRPPSSDPSIPPGEEECERKCDECSKILLCDKDYELHMAVVHGYHWYYHFATEEEFQAWLRAEGLDETMLNKKRNQNASGIVYRLYICAYNYKKTNDKKEKCQSRLHVRTDRNGIAVRYRVIHCHKERIIRRNFTIECRQLVRKLFADGLQNYEILKTVKETFAPSSLNYLMKINDIQVMRKRYRARLRKQQELESAAPAHVKMEEDSTSGTRPELAANFSANVVPPLPNAHDDQEEIVMLPSPKSEDNASSDSDSSLNF